MKSLNRLLILILCLCCTSSISSCGRSSSENGTTNECSKFVGSTDTVGYIPNMPIYESISDLSSKSELIVIGSFSLEPETVSEESLGETLYASKYTFNLQEVVKGDIKDKSIYVMQTGKPNSDNYETKIKKNKSYLLFLRSKDFKGTKVYDCTGVEQGIFEIKENKLYSYVDFGISSKYDNKSKDDLISEVKNLIKNK